METSRISSHAMLGLELVLKNRLHKPIATKSFWAKNTFWTFSSWIKDSLAPAEAFATWSNVTVCLSFHWHQVFWQESSFFCLFFFFSYHFTIVIDLLLGLLSVQKFLRKASSRWAIFTMEELREVTLNFVASFSLKLLSILVYMWLSYTSK